MADNLGLSVLLSLVTGAVYAYVGLRLSERKVSPEARPAHGLFVTFWFGLSFSSIVGAATTGLYMADRLELWVYSAIVQVQIFVIVLVLAALMYYLVYVYTGSNRWLVPMALVYFLFWVLLVALIEWVPAPERITDDGWQVQTEPEVEISHWVGLVFIFALIGPQVAAAIAYARLYRKAGDNTQRYRIAMVSGTIILWFGTSLVGGTLGAGGEGWQLFTRLLGVLASLLILMAYLPPSGLKRKWGLRSIADEAMGSPSPRPMEG